MEIKGDVTKYQSEGKTLFMGIADLEIIGVNPDVEWLQETLKLENIREPEYVSETEEGDAKLRLDVYYKIHPATNKKGEVLEDSPIKSLDESPINRFSLFLEDAERDASKSGNTLYVNEKGENTWTIPEKLDNWPDNRKFNFDSDSPYRKAMVGEDQLLYLMAQVGGLTNKAKKAGCCLGPMTTSWSQICAGNVSEIRDFLLGSENKGFRAELGVQVKDDNRYQAVYTKRTAVKGLGDAGIKRALKTDVEKNYPWKANYDANDFSLKIYSDKFESSQAEVVDAVRSELQV